VITTWSGNQKGVPDQVFLPKPDGCAAAHTGAVLTNESNDTTPIDRSAGAPRRLVVLVGNPKPRSRTLDIAEMVAARVSRAYGATHVATVDLCNYSDLMFRWPDEHLSVISKGVAAADILVVASPTYKGSYTGLLKGFLDRYPFNALDGVMAIPIMTGSDPIHGLAPDYTLRPLLVELGASVPTKGLFFQIAQMGTAAAVVDQWAAANLPRRTPVAAAAPSKPATPAGVQRIQSVANPMPRPPTRLPPPQGRALDTGRYHLTSCPAEAAV
jgi:FMN reductase